jgi:hypothetical protein
LIAWALIAWALITRALVTRASIAIGEAAPRAAVFAAPGRRRVRRAAAIGPVAAAPIWLAPARTAEPARRGGRCAASIGLETALRRRSRVRLASALSPRPAIAAAARSAIAASVAVIAVAVSAAIAVTVSAIAVAPALGGLGGACGQRRTECEQRGRDRTA